MELSCHQIQKYFIMCFKEEKSKRFGLEWHFEWAIPLIGAILWEKEMWYDIINRHSPTNKYEVMNSG